MNLDQRIKDIARVTAKDRCSDFSSYASSLGLDGPGFANEQMAYITSLIHQQYQRRTAQGEPITDLLSARKKS